MATLVLDVCAHSPEETKVIGQQIYSLLQWPATVYLRGDLGAGKTTLCQSIIAAAGYAGSVTSPTYNLIHEYPVFLPAQNKQGTAGVGAKRAQPLSSAQHQSGIIYHIDLYRLDDPQELEYLGIADLAQPNSLFLVEWPENGNGYLQSADYIVEIAESPSPSDNARNFKLYQTG